MSNGKGQKPGVKTYTMPQRRGGLLEWLERPRPIPSPIMGLRRGARRLWGRFAGEPAWEFPDYPTMQPPMSYELGGQTGWAAPYEPVGPGLTGQFPGYDPNAFVGYGGEPVYEPPVYLGGGASGPIGDQYMPARYGRGIPTMEQVGPEGLPQRMMVRETQRMTQPGTPTGAGGAGAGGRAPSRPELGNLINVANESWWSEFERVHGESPKEYYSRYPNRYPGATWEESVNNDLAWAHRVQRETGRGPTEQQWVQHYYDVRGWYAPREQQSFEAYNLRQQYGWK